MDDSPLLNHYKNPKYLKSHQKDGSDVVYRTIVKTIIALIFTLFSQTHISWAALRPPTGRFSFELTSVFKKNPKIWGTYKLSHERLSANKKRLSKEAGLISDLVISNGELIFVRESKEEGLTKILVEKLRFAWDP